MTELNSLKPKQVRAVWNKNNQEWFFVVADLVRVLTKTNDAKEYTKKLRKYDKELAKVWNRLAVTLKVDTKTGLQSMNCANAICITKIILSVHSPKTKLLKKWINSLNINPFEKKSNFKLSDNALNDFYKILSNPNGWLQKKELFALTNNTLPS